MGRPLIPRKLPTIEGDLGNFGLVLGGLFAWFCPGRDRGVGVCLSLGFWSCRSAQIPGTGRQWEAHSGCAEQQVTALCPEVFT